MARIVFMRTLLALFAALAAFTLLAGCGGKSVVGKWDMTMSSTDPQAGVALAQMGTLKDAMEFKSDDTFTLTVMTNTMEGTYKVEGKEITLSPKDASAAGSPNKLTMSDDGESLTGSEGPITVNLTRSKGEEKAG